MPEIDCPRCTVDCAVKVHDPRSKCMGCACPNEDCPRCGIAMTEGPKCFFCGFVLAYAQEFGVQ
jgi:hypothetical protein